MTMSVTAMKTTCAVVVRQTRSTICSSSEMIRKIDGIMMTRRIKGGKKGKRSLVSASKVYASSSSSSSSPAKTNTNTNNDNSSNYDERMSRSNEDEFHERDDGESTKKVFSISPLEPSSAVGVRLRAICESDPNSFEEAMEEQVRVWQIEEEEKQKEETTTTKKTNTLMNDKMEIDDDDDIDRTSTTSRELFSDRAFAKLMKKREVEDALYLCIAMKHANKGVELTNDFENVRLRRSGLVKRCQVLSSQFLPTGSEDILNKHLLGVLSNVSTNGGLNPENFEKYIPKVVLAHVYQRSAAYGYFLRRVEKRYNVERLFSTTNNTAILTTTTTMQGMPSQKKTKLSSESLAPSGMKRTLNFRAKPRLRKHENDIAHGKVDDFENDEFCVVDETVGTRTCLEPQLHSFKAYIESLDPEVRAQAARIQSAEARGALERHVEALFGPQASNSNELTERMRELELLITKASTKRQNGQNDNNEDVDVDDETDLRLQTSYFEIETMEMTLDNLKHLVIEACAFGGELCCAEDKFDGVI